jgi:ABC-type transporter MlaC component
VTAGTAVAFTLAVAAPDRAFALADRITGPDAPHAAVSAPLANRPFARAAGSPSGPLDTLRRTEAELRSAVDHRPPPDWSPEADVRRVRIDQLLKNLLDFDEIARRSLSAAWPSLTPAQRREFVTTFSALTGQTLIAKARWRHYRLAYQNEVITGPAAIVIVGVSSLDPTNTPVERLEYKLTWNGARWQVTDIIVDGTSTVALYQREFAGLMKRVGFKGLMAKMQERLAATSGQ